MKEEQPLSPQNEQLGRFLDAIHHGPSIPEILLKHGFVEQKGSYFCGEHEIYESAVGWCYSYIADDNFGVAPLPNLTPENLPTLLHILGITPQT